MTLFNQLSQTPLWVALPGLLLAYLTLSSLATWYPLRHIPGPPLARISYLWLLRTTASGRAALTYRDLAHKYGPLVRIGPNHLLTSDPAVLRRMSAARSAYGKDPEYSATIRHPDHHSMISTLDVKKHDAIKAKLAGPYGGRETSAMEPVVDEILGQLVAHMQRKVNAGGEGKPTVLDFNTVSNYFTMDTFTRIAFGEEMGFLATDSDVHGLIAAIVRAMYVATIPLSVPWFRDITTSRLFMKVLGPSPKDKTGLGAMVRIAQNAVQARYQPGAPDENDLLGAFKRAGLEAGPCMSEVLLSLVAGSDTTSSSIRFTMLHMMTTPRVYAKLKSIVKEAEANGTITPGVPIKQEQAKKIPYLQAIIYEGLRMRPPAAIAFTKVVPPEGDNIDDKVIPGGTSIMGINLPMMRSREFWGDDGDLFRPERFLEADDTTRAGMERLVEMVFGYGRYRCAGQPLALMELNKVFFELFRYFDFQVVNPLKPWDPLFYTAWRDDNFMVQVTAVTAD